MAMKLETEPVLASDLSSMDRQVIRVDMLPTHAGITAALRRAFEAAATEPCDRDFAELLRRLNCRRAPSFMVAAELVDFTHDRLEGRLVGVGPVLAP